MIRRWRARFSGGFSFADLNRAWLGAFTVMAIGAAVAGVAAFGTLGLLNDRYAMSGVFHDSAGMRPGDLVRVAGIDVGQVTAVEPDFQAGQVVITWEVDRNVHLGPRTSAEVAVTTLLGGVYLRLTGPVVEPYLDSMPLAERRIPIERTRTPYTVTDALADATTRVQQLDVGNVDQLVGQLSDLTADNRDDVGRLAADLAAVAGAVNDRQAELDKLLTDTQSVTDALAAKDAELGQLVDHAGVLLAELAGRRDALQAILGSGSQVVGQLSALVRDHQAQLRGIIDDLHATLQVTDANLADLNRGLAYVGPTFHGFSTITKQGAWLDVVTDALPAADFANLLQQVLGSQP